MLIFYTYKKPIHGSLIWKPRLNRIFHKKKTCHSIHCWFSKQKNICSMTFVIHFKYSNRFPDFLNLNSIWKCNLNYNYYRFDSFCLTTISSSKKHCINCFGDTFYNKRVLNFLKSFVDNILHRVLVCILFYVSKMLQNGCFHISWRVCRIRMQFLFQMKTQLHRFSTK